MGKRAMGALEFKLTRGPKTQKSSALQMNNLSFEARKYKGFTADDMLSVTKFE